MDTTRNKIIQIISKLKTTPAAIFEQTNLHTDLNIDSLSFIAILLEIESAFSITFSLVEMSDCAIFKNLVNIVENKLK